MSRDGSLELRQIINVVRRWLWLITACTVLAGATAFYVEARQDHLYEATATLMVEPAYDSLANQYNALIASERLALTYSEMILGTQVLESAIADSGVEIPVASLKKLLRVEPVVNTQLIRISIRHTSPAAATALANSLAERFDAHVRELQESRFSTHLQELSANTEAVEANIRETQSRLNAAKSDLVRNQLDLARMQSLLSQLVQLSTTEGDTLQRLIIANGLVRQLVSRTVMQPSDLTDDGSTLAVNELATIPDLIERVRTEIDEIAAIGTSTSANIAELELLLGQYDDELRTGQRDLEQVQLMAAEGANAIVITQPAVVPQDPIRHRLLTVTLAALIGALIALGVAFLCEYLDDKIQTTQDVREALQLDVLGSVGHLPKNMRTKLAVAHSPSVIDEAYRILGARVRYVAREGSIRTVMITSPGAEEGKSTTVANLAVALGQTGLQVIAMDGDLRNPRLHTLFGLEPGKGFGEALRADRAELCLRSTPFEGVRLLICGTSAREPAQVLSSGRLPELLNELAQSADIVLVDSPPVLAVADSTILARQVDGVLLVLRAGRSTRQAACMAVASLRQVGSNLIGTVVNEAEENATAYYRRYAGSERTDGMPDATPAWSHVGGASGRMSRSPEPQ